MESRQSPTLAGSTDAATSLCSTTRRRPPFGGVIESFNISTNSFASRYVFKRLRFLGSKQLSHTLALLFLAVWHGFASGFYNTFALELVIMKMETDVSVQDRDRCDTRFPLTPHFVAHRSRPS